MQGQTTDKGTDQTLDAKRLTLMSGCRRLGLVNADIRQLAVALDYADALTSPADCD
jgi:hypothetical protein